MRREAILGLVGVALLLFAWQIGATIADSPHFSSPYETAARLSQFLSSARYWSDIAATSYRWIVGFALGCAVGAPLGLAMGMNRDLFSLFSFSFDFLRSLPVTAIFPLFLLMFGIGDASKIAMVFTGTVFVVALSAAYGVIHSSPLRRRMARAYGASSWGVVRRVVLFEALPHIIVGMRATITIALIVVVVSEMFIGSERGLGQQMYAAYQRNLAVDLYASLVVVGVLGYLSNSLFGWLEEAVAPWAGQ